MSVKSYGTPLALLLVSTLLPACCRNDILVTVENASGQPLSGVMVVTESTEPVAMQMGDLAAQRRASSAFVPSQDTSLRLEYSTPGEGRRVQRLGNYISRGHCGEIEVVLGADLEPSYREELDFTPCWLGAATRALDR